LNLRDARTCVDRAREHNETLGSVYREWVASRGIGILCHRDAEVMRWEFDAAITREPSTNLSILAGEVLDALRRALDYIAWQVYVSGSAVRSDQQDRVVYFPIVTEAAGWDKQLGSKVPGASEAYVEALRASQPFAQHDANREMLPKLAAFINRDKHRRLSLFATGAFKVTARAPQLDADLEMIMAIISPFPSFHVAESLQAILDRALAMGDGRPVMISFLVSFIELRRKDPDDPGGRPVARAEGITMADPPPPELHVGFATEDGDHITLPALGKLIDHVADILMRFERIAPMT
jgi:hypothetical protein